MGNKTPPSAEELLAPLWTICPVCPDNAKAVVNLENHLRAVHRIPAVKSNELGLLYQAKEKEKPMAKEEAAVCPTCALNEYKYEQERNRAKALEGQLTEAQKKGIEMPSLKAMLNHCESGECVSHHKELDDLKLKIVQLAYQDQEGVAKAAEQLGLLPKRIVLTR